MFLTYVAGIGLFVLHVRNVDLEKPWLLVALCVLASVSLILKVEGSTNRSHYSFNFLVYGFTFAVLGTSAAILVIVVSNLVEWIWNKPAWYIQFFNTTCYIIVMQAAGIAYSLVNPSLSHDTWQTVVGIMLGMTTFNMLNHLMVGIIVWLARGENLKQSGIFDFFPLMLDLALLTFGASLSFVWNYNTHALALFLIPLYLIYSTLRVPALERKTEIDSKTGLFNHEYFKKQLSNELVRANRFDRPLSVIIADLDLLRNINNTYGHLAGDEVLIGIARAMKDSVRDYDVVCRFGGEEFAILLPETNLAQAFERAEIIRKRVEGMEFTVATSVTPIRATLSLGVANRESFSQAQDDITHNADLALYHSKLSGRNRCFAFSNESYVDFSNSNAVRTPVPPVAEETHKDYAVASAIPSKTKAPEAVSAAQSSLPIPPSKEALQGEIPLLDGVTSQGSKRTVSLFIGGLAALSVLAFAILTQWVPFTINTPAFDLLGLLVISLLIVLSEGFSVDLYIRNSSVSTSAIPILVAYLLFGPIGVGWASLILAISLIVKYRSQFSRFVFNFSNHLLAGTLIAGLVRATGGNFLAMPPAYQIILSLASSIILFLSSTWMIAFGMSLDIRQPVRQIWYDQYRWLSTYYLGIGFIAYALIFGYKYDHITGLLLMIVPMILLRISQKQYVDRTRQVVTELREKNQILKKNSEEISELNEGLLVTLSEIIDLRDPYVLGHSKQVSKYATEIAKTLGLNEKQVDLIRKAGLLHDIGKLGISMEILTKPGKLTPEEYESIKEHAALGGELVKGSPSLRPLVPIIRHHHEFFNGQGYPDKLAGNQISIEARVVAVADAIEAMTSDRPYRKALKPEQVIDELNKHSGTQFDPLVIKEAVKILESSIAGESVQQISADNVRIAPRLTVNIQTP
jgi:diguanylate cyclase (GGDEF)-like protein/putative nucleotidyltransferase with HDIG domain